MPGSRLALSLAGRTCLTAGVAGALVIAPSALAKPGAALPTTTINVIAGKPTELAFKLSKLSNIKPGTVVFKVVNEGVAYHTFKICTSPAKTDAKNACVGKVTKLLKHGNTATLTIKLTKGQYEYLCTVPGHAAAGMKGLIGVGVKVTPGAVVAPPKPTTTTSPTKTTPSPVTTTPTPPNPNPQPPTSECPPGQTIAANGPGDQDDDDTGAVSDGDGCI